MVSGNFDVIGYWCIDVMVDKTKDIVFFKILAFIGGNCTALP